jgi:hypothetical protein
LIIVRNKQRFDDVGEQDANGFYDYVYRGFNYELSAGEGVFYVRIYDDEPGVAIVVKPVNARATREARQLVDFITTNLACTVVRFKAPDGGYRPVDIGTLEFADVI